MDCETCFEENLCNEGQDPREKDNRNNRRVQNKFTFQVPCLIKKSEKVGEYISFHRPYQTTSNNTETNSPLAYSLVLSLLSHLIML